MLKEINSAGYLIHANDLKTKSPILKPCNSISIIYLPGVIYLILLYANGYRDFHGD